MPDPRFFSGGAAFRTWLERHHASAGELVVAFRKVHVKPRGLTYQEALDAALCFGWIDGVRRSMGDDAFSIRFTPRRRGSVWSEVNVRRMHELLAAGAVSAAGRAAFEARDEAKTASYSYEREQARLSDEQMALLRRNARASAYYDGLPAGYRRMVLHWIVSAKREETQARRLAQFIELCANGERLNQLSPPSRQSNTAKDDGARVSTRARPEGGASPRRPGR